MTDIEIRLLGPLEVRRAGELVRLSGSKQRAALALLALHAGRVVSVDRLVETLWGEAAPATAVTALQGHVSRLRRLLGADVIATRPPGYVLEVETASVDALRFEQLAAATAQDPAARARRLAEALSLWRGPALADLPGTPGLAEDARRLEDLRLARQEDLFDLELALGRHAELVPRLEALVADEPLRERPVEQLMRALYHGGRQADALAAYRRYRQQLRDELGLEPSRPLRELERRVLEHDPALAPPAQPPAEETDRRAPLSVVAVEVSAGQRTSAELDAEAYARAAMQVREAVRLALERHGGSVQSGAGATLVALFGAPEPREDDASRALQAASAAVQAAESSADDAARRFGVALGARAGVASGEAFAGQSPAVEHALRLAATAQRGAVLADDRTRARARDPELRLDRPLHGREPERRRLREAYERVTANRRSEVVVLTGSPGIGKSRLAIDAVLGLELATRVLLARCLSYGDGVSLLPLIDLVRSAAELPERATDRQARERIAALVGECEHAAAVADQLLRLIGLGRALPPDDECVWAVRRLLEALADQGPVVVVLDDLHWAAPPVLDLVEQLAQPAPVPLLLLATARELPREALAAAALPVRSLDRVACAGLVATLLGSDAVDPAAVSALADASGGNPLFLEELVLDLRDEGRLQETERGWRLDASGLAAPRSIESLLAARLARLPERERSVLACASVMGRSFALEALADLYGATVDEPVASLVATGILRPSLAEGDDVEFRHLLIRDAAYASIPLERRADLHERHAAWLDRSRLAAPLERESLAIYHLDQSQRALATLAPGDERLAAGASRLAGRAAALGRVLLGRGNAEAAAALLARSTELEEHDPRILIDLGQAHLDRGDFAAAREAFAAALGSSADRRARLGLLDLRLRTQPTVDLDAAEREIETARMLLEEEGDADGVAEAWSAGAHLRLIRGRTAELADLLEPALEHARRSGNARTETWMLFLRCAICWHGPRPVAEGIGRCEEVLAGAHGRPGVEAAALQSLGVLHAMQGEFEEARRRIGAARAILREAGYAIGAAASAIDEGVVELLASDYAAAESALRGGYEELERLAEKGYFSTVASLLADAVASQGRLEEARSLAAAAALAASADDVVSQIGWRAAEARALAAFDEAEHAERIARGAVVLADATDFSLARSQAWAALADVLERQGDSATAAAARATAASILERKGCSPEAIRGWTRARLGP